MRIQTAYDPEQRFMRLAAFKKVFDLVNQLLDRARW
jgi:hypothetical protein